MSEYDVAIIGGGAAGLSAALVLSRAQRKVLVVDDVRNAVHDLDHGFSPSPTTNTQYKETP